MPIEETQKYPRAKRCGERIAALRNAQGWSQRELAKRAQFSNQQISKVEAGEINTPIETLARIAHALGIPLLTLVEDETDPLASGGVLLPLVVDLAASVETAYALLAAAVPKLREARQTVARLGEVTGVPLPPLREDTPRAEVACSHVESVSFFSRARAYV